MMKTNSDYLQHWCERYKKELTEDIMPFWMAHGWDREHGGVYTCLNRDGSLMDSTKSVWFQGRFAWVCSAAYRHITPEAQWLEAARSTIEFIERHCFDETGHMYFSVTADGCPLRKRRYIFSESFAAIAMSEYALASGNRAYAEKALELFKRMLKFLNTPGLLAPKFESNVRLLSHSPVMILMGTAARIKEAIDDPVLSAEIDRSLGLISNCFMHPEFKALLETVGEHGEFIDTNMTRTINPGHAIETAWFIFEEARTRNWDKELVDLATRIFDWSWDWGWDEQYGGIINFRDCRGLPHQDYSQDMKFWWPQCETIITSLYAYWATGNELYLDRHRQISEWTYRHFPDADYGEWFGYLHRDGSVAQPAKGNLFKGPFHIPRMMIKAHLLCRNILDSR